MDLAQENLAKRWNDTDMTMAHFSGSSNKDNDEKRSSQDWTAFTNDKLAALLYPNICRTLSDSYAAFGYVDKVESFGWLEKQSVRVLGSLAMYMAASRVKSTYDNISLLPF